jgi:hypothetical protein
MDKSTIVIGGGEIGNSVYNVLSNEYEVDLYDIKYPKGDLEEMEKNTYVYMHICFPYGNDFIEQVNKYKEIFKPKYVIVHSTVRVGTCSDLGAYHSPCLGIHPDLTISMKTFTKFISGGTADGRAHLANYFRRAGLTIYLTDKSETTELSKIMCTTYYGMNIEFTKEMKRQCDLYGVPFEFWTIWNNNYNQGYTRLNHPEYVRQNLVPMMSEQGGHCTIPNTKLLDNNFTRLLDIMNSANGAEIDYISEENLEKLNSLKGL